MDTMDTTPRKKTKIDIDYIPMFNKLVTPFCQNYDKKRIIKKFCKKYQLENSVGLMYELYLKGNGKTNNMVASAEQLKEFVEDAADLMMAVFFRYLEEAEQQTEFEEAE